MSNVVIATLGALVQNWIYGWDLSFNRGVWLIFLYSIMLRLFQPVSDRLAVPIKAWLQRRWTR